MGKRSIGVVSLSTERSRQLIYNAGALGCLASHVALWKRCARDGKALHIAEDDAVLRHDFISAGSVVVAALLDWDFVLWTWNFDWPMKARLGTGLGSVVIQSNQDELRRDWEKFRDSTAKPVVARLASAAGMAIYSISPRGARRLLSRAFPVAGLPAEYVAKPNTSWINTGADVELSRQYENLDAFVTIPPLAISLNEGAISTVQGQ